VGYAPAEARCKVYILDEAHQVTTDAFNALLKTLEEPPSHTYFVLATTEPHKVPATIMSRCQRFDFRTISLEDICGTLRRIAEEEGVQIEDAALSVIAQAAQGAMRDAESIFDQIVAYADGPIDLQMVNDVLGMTPAETLVQMVDIIIANNLPQAFEAIDDLVKSGRDLGQFLSDLTGYVRDLLRLATGANPPQWLALEEKQREQMHNQAQALGVGRLMEIIHKLAAAQEQMRSTTQHVLLLELTMAELCQVAVPAVSQAKPQVAPPPAPQPAPAAQPQPARPPAAKSVPQPARPPGGPLTLEAVLERWPLVPEELKRMGRMPVGAIVREAYPAALDGDTLLLAIDEQFKFHYSKLNGEYREVVEEALAHLLGRKLTVKCQLGPAQGVDRPPETPKEEESKPDELPANAPAGGDEAVQQAVAQTLQLFEGSVELEEES